MRISQTQIRDLVVATLDLAKAASPANKLIYVSDQRKLFRCTNGSVIANGDTIHAMTASGWFLIEVNQGFQIPNLYLTTRSYAVGDRCRFASNNWVCTAAHNASEFPAARWRPELIPSANWSGGVSATTYRSGDVFYMPSEEALFQWVFPESRAVAVADLDPNNGKFRNCIARLQNDTAYSPSYTPNTTTRGGIIGLFPGPDLGLRDAVLQSTGKWVKPTETFSTSMADDTVPGGALNAAMGLRIDRLLKRGFYTTMRGDYDPYQCHMTTVWASGIGGFVWQMIPWRADRSSTGCHSVLFNWHVQKLGKLYGMLSNDNGGSDGLLGWCRTGGYHIATSNVACPLSTHYAAMPTGDYSIDVDNYNTSSEQHYVLWGNSGTGNTGCYTRMSMNEGTPSFENQGSRNLYLARNDGNWTPSGDSFEVTSYTVWNYEVLSAAYTGSAGNAMTMLLPVRLVYNPAYFAKNEA